MDLAIKILAVVLGIAAAFAVYPWLDVYLVAVLAFIGAIAAGVIAGIAVDRILRYVFAKQLRRL